ncbi:hypothetical protein CMQ_3638 [Grosmannia clavigera kw1407]|uniref:C2H2-type domain-containing protein n=1 Tax=Grosmannia clavigera (strain kw1407 / UAMH 11150) TaxID=655863 RepID=F0X9Y0_GROCL|nr:uncharacterized protein CMQ_3638 [Grosmannia clavigera kw1407]EFX05569.1 hypothetical protein CMQ_3638 [Grosmannia clavigera kw1407]
MTKAILDNGIAQMDTERIITDQQPCTQNLLLDEASTASTSSMPSPMLTPTSADFLDSYPSSPTLVPLSGSMPTIHDVILALQSNPQPATKRCPFCPATSTRMFKPGALQQHLSSGVHGKMSVALPQQVPGEILFHCPLALMNSSSKDTTPKYFSAVSALAQHIESGACHDGKKTFSRAIEYLQQKMEAVGLGGLKLVN